MVLIFRVMARGMGKEFLGILLLLVSIYVSFCAYFVGVGFFWGRKKWRSWVKCIT
jgi:hypothetical protein